MIDIHCIPVPGFEDNLRDIIETCETPASKLLIGNYVEGNILLARFYGFALGYNPYVTWVDGDDVVLNTSWFDQAIELLKDESIVAVSPRTQAVKRTGQIVNVPFPHHLTIMRRQPVLELLERAIQSVGTLMSGTERYLLDNLTKYGRIEKIDVLAYEWRLRNESGRTIADPPDALRKLRTASVRQ